MLTPGERARASRPTDQDTGRTFDAVPEALVLHADGVILAANPAWLRLHGLPDATLARGRGIAEFIHPDDRPGTAGRMRDLASGDAPQSVRQLRILRSDGGAVAVEAKSARFGSDGSALITSLREIEPARRLYAALSRTNEAVARESSFASLAGRVCRIAVEDGGMTSAVIRLANPGRNLLEEVAAHGPRPRLAGRGEIRLDDSTGLASTAFRTRRPVIVGDVELPSAATATVVGARARGIRSAAAFPLTADGETIGTLTVFARDENAIDAVSAELLGEFADAVSFAHARFAAEARVERLSGMYDALSRTNAAIVRGRDWHSLCATVCRIIVEQGKVVSAVIRTPSADAGHLELFAGYGPRVGKVGTRAIPVDEAHPVARAFVAGFTSVVADVLNDPELASSRDDSQALGIRSSIVIGLKAGDARIGVLSVFAASHNHFDAELARLFEDLSGNLAYARQKLLADSATTESEAHYRTLVDASPDAIRVICDERIVMINPAGRRLFALDAGADIRGRSPFDFIHPDYHARSRERLREVIEGGHPAAPTDTIYVRPDGTTVEVEVTSLPFTWRGRPAALSIIRDLSERRAGERALAEAEERYRALVEGSMNGVMLLENEVVAYANTGAATMLGLDSAAAAIGRHVRSLVEPEFHAATSANLAQLMARPELSMPRTFVRLRRGDGVVIDVDTAAASIDLAGRRMIQVELRDVTRERQALSEIRSLNENLEARIAERTRELTDANRDLESFSYSVAHDLRAPLRAMAGFARLLEIDLAANADTELPGHVARIVEAATRMNTLVDGLLAVARVTHGNLAGERVDMEHLVREVVREARPGPAVRLAIGPLPAVLGDPAALRQVWTNLLSNALKYSARRNEPEIDIGATVIGAECAFHVRDNGAGFDPAYASRLFGVFQRLHPVGEFEGTGVGLAVVRRVVERHGGRVWAEGCPGAGAAFHFALPAARLAPPPR